MKIKVANYIADFLVKNGISHVFTVTGGGAMHLNDALGHQKGLKCIYNHHEQACSIAGESYARIHNKIAAVCVTTGPGGTNALTGVVGGYLDSIPMLIISGQVRYDTTARSTGLDLRAMGDQEFDICKSVEAMTKYCEMVIDSKKIRYCLEKALYIAQHGRPGPCWLDIPLNVQGAYIETDELEGYDEEEYKKILPPKVNEKTVENIIEKIKQAKRPVLYAGSGIRISKGYEAFKNVIEKLNIPIVTAWNSIDVVCNDNPLYVGRGGIRGDRAGNFAVQNSDLILSIGCRLNLKQVGFNSKTWAREAYVIMCDIDENELKKPTLHVEMPVWADARDLLEKLDKKLSNKKVFNEKEWIYICQKWKNKYPVVLPKHKKNIEERGSVYYFIKELSLALKENQITVSGCGSAGFVGAQAYIIKKGQRFIVNSAVATMGYDLPAAIGVMFAKQNDLDVICLAGDRKHTNEFTRITNNNTL